MKAKTFLKQARELMSQKKIAKYLGGDLREVSTKMLLLNLRVLCVEYGDLQEIAREAQRKLLAAEEEAPDNRFVLKPGETATVRILPEKAGKTTKSGDYTVTLPKGYVVFHTPEVAGANCNTWDLMRRGHHIGILREDRDGTFSAAHDKLEMGHDCIDTLQDAVDCLIDNHEEYIGRKTGRKG